MKHETFPEGSYLTKLTMVYGKLLGNFELANLLLTDTQGQRKKTNKSPNEVFACMLQSCCIVCSKLQLLGLDVVVLLQYLQLSGLFVN